MSGKLVSAALLAAAAVSLAACGGDVSTLRSEGDDCVVSLDYETISLAAPPA